MPKALMLTTDQVIDRRILLEADALEADGWSVTILAMPGRKQTADPRVVQIGGASARRSTPGIAFPILRAYHDLRRRIPANAPWMSRIKSLIWHGFLRPDMVLRSVMLPSALDHPADVVVAHDLPLLPAAVAVAKAHGAKLVYDSHELYCEQGFTPRVHRMWSKIERAHIGQCDAIITVNRSIAGELERRYGAAPVHVVQNAERGDGPAPEKGRLLHEAFGLPSSAAVVLFQGGLLPGRHLEALVDAMALVRAPSAHLVFLGDGPMVKKLRRRAERAGVGKRIHFHGAVPQHELLRFTASADLGLIPYQATCLNNLYCTPNKLFEYIAAGVPIVASDLPELRRVIGDNGIGLIIDAGSPETFARAIDLLIPDPGKLQDLRERVLAVSRRLNWEQESKVLLQVFDGLRQ
jgi:glycosyltransferase involved in cell wall biosynthesis